ncbi:7490_t:CDS:2 [Paraglomus brasilianum]|uniref:7490_t:CDS:1 n=1 Tax=Paraglomus brasilianum TaxID=144538 RepID=A0A9N8VYQ3_9GLOM|nr:7490_t:CDS:2 [Paraglomus brasilianum]
MSSYRRKSKRLRSNTSPVNRDNQEERSRILTQIEALESEIVELQTKIDNERKKKQELVSPTNDIIQHLIQINDHALRSSINLKSEEEYRTSGFYLMKRKAQWPMLIRLSSFTKVQFSKVTNYLVTAADGHHIRHYILSGASYGLHFSVDFDADETESCIQTLRIKIGESIKAEIAKFVARNLFGFFKGFVQYAKLNYERTSLFDVLKGKYPDLIAYNDLTHGRNMSESTSDVGNKICPLLRFTLNSSPKHPDIIFLWRNKVSDKGEIFPELFYSFFKTLVGQVVTVELKNDLAITGALVSVDQFLNIKLDNIRVVDQQKYPHMMAVKNCFIRGSVVRYVQLPANAVDTALLQDAARREAQQPTPAPRMK